MAPRFRFLAGQCVPVNAAITSAMLLSAVLLLAALGSTSALPIHTRMMQAQWQASALEEVEAEASAEANTHAASLILSSACVDDPLFKEWTHLGVRVKMPNGVNTMGTCKWFASAPHWCQLAGPHRTACKAACSQVLPDLCA
jgi:hypothetical protein